MIEITHSRPRWSVRLAVLTAIASTQSFADAPPAAASIDQLQEVIVTGERRVERLQDAAVAVNAITADTIREANVTRPGDALRLMPNVTFVQSNEPGEFFVTIRGNTAVREGDNSVALVVDGVQSYDPNSFNQELVDIQQIEVLKGPQGALYGRDAIGGAVVVNTVAPNTQRWEGGVKLTAGNGDDQREQVKFSGPVTSNFAVRGAFSHEDRNGFYKNIKTGEEPDRFWDDTGFLRGLWQVNDKITADFKLTGARSGGGGINWSAIIIGATAPNISADNTSIPYTANIGGFSKNFRYGASMKWDFDLDFAKLTSVTSYAELFDHYGADSYPYFYDPSLFNVYFPGNAPVGLGAQTQVTIRDATDAAQEFRLQSPDTGKLKWMVGVSYLKFRVHDENTTGADTNGVQFGLGPWPYVQQTGGTGAPGGPIVNGTPVNNQTLGFLDAQSDNNARAAFGTISYDLAPVELTASLRYDKEERNQTDLAFPGAPNPLDPKAVPIYQIKPWRSRSASFAQTQPKFTAKYTVMDGIITYASWGRGFKSGGFNPFGTGALLKSFNPASTVGDVFPKEVADTWEIGFKTQWFERRLTFNGAYFDTKSKNAQLLEFFPQATLQAISSADAVHMKGFEVEAAARVLEGLDLVASYGYLDARVTAFATQPTYIGNHRPQTSPYTAMLAAQYGHSLGIGTWAWSARADYTRQGTTYWDWSNTPGSERSPLGLANGRIAARDDHWEIALWSKNLTNKSYNSESIVLLPFAAALYRAPPRQYGGDVSYRF